MSHANPQNDTSNAGENAILGMIIFIISLSVLFIATMAGYVVVRLRAEQWPPPGTPPLPWTLWMSTVVLIGCSISIHRALTSVERNNQPALCRALVVSLVLGVSFLLLQALNWVQLIQAQMPVGASLYAFTFYTLTGLHALHVIAGIGQLGVVTHRAFSGIYSPASHTGVTIAVMYWHFLDAVWLLMFFCLMALS